MQTQDVPVFRRAVSNLVQYGIAHCSAGSQLVVQIRPDDHLPKVTITNAGETIAQA